MVAWLLAMAASLSACGRDATAEQPPPLVRTIVVGHAAPPSVNYTGAVHARIESDLGFRVAGKIASRLVDPGTFVRAGQVLMRIDSADLALGAAAAQDRLRAAEAEAIRAGLEERRRRALLAPGFVSRSDYDAVLAAQRAGAANLRAARAQAREAANARSYADLVADAEGVITDVLAQPGQVVTAGEPIVRLARAGAREALIAVPETARSGLPPQATAHVLGDPRSYPATLREVAGAADPLTRTFAARYVLDAPASAAPLGATVTIAASRPGSDLIGVPAAAVTDQGHGPGVWLVGADLRVSFRAVAIASFGDDWVLLRPGSLHDGDRIVALGAHLLRAGQRVRLSTGN